MSMPQMNGYRGDYDRYYGSRPRPRDEYRREDPYETRDPYSRGEPYRDPRDEMYSKVVRETRTNGTLEGYKPYKVESSDYQIMSYDLDHLATYTVGAQQGLMSPQDGMKKLRQMQIQMGIWTMRVQMLIDSQDIVILDKQSMEEMERFPIHLVIEPTAVSNRDKRDVYNNIVMFTVKEDDHKRAPTEMHIFQVLNKPAQAVVDDIKAAKADMLKSGRSYNHGVPSPHIQERIQRYEQEARQAYHATTNYAPEAPQVGRQFRQSMKRPDDTDTVVTERTDRDVQLLNHCFDDIEKFVGRLQQAADAFKELDLRRRGRSDRSKDRHYRHGDGMLTMRARPPPAKDFIDIFQKFKLSFNLLAKLKPHIHDPNAPELVHFLFTPLSLVVEASKDPRHGTPDLASKVVSPLLSPEAKDLLLNCLTSKEADLWMSLGDAWTVSRDQWKGYVPPYFPRFSDGWQPDPAWMDETQPHSTMGRSEGRVRQQPDDSFRREDAARYRDDRDGYNQRDGGYNQRDGGYNQRDGRRSPSPARSRDYRDDYQRDYDQRERESREMRERENRQRERELAERAQREREERDRRLAEERARYNDRGVPPKSGGSKARDSYEVQQENFLRDLRSRNAKIYESTHEREGRNEKELTIKKGEILEVVEGTRNWWKLRNHKGQEGYAPYTILQEYKVDGDQPHIPTHPTLPHTTLLTTVTSEPRTNAVTSRNTLPSSSSPTERPQYATVFPAKKVIASTATIDQPDSVPDKQDLGAIRNSRNDLHNELIKTLHKKRAKKNTPGGNRSPPAYINQKSNPNDVQIWLDSKGFTSSVQMTLLGHNGAELFKLSKAKLEKMFGHEEGTRLYSQITVQRNLTGYNTGRSAELQAILKQRRVKAETPGEDSGIESNNQTSEYVNDHNNSGYDTHISLSDVFNGER